MAQNKINVGAVIVVDRGIVGDPENIGIAAAVGCIVGEAEAMASEALDNQVVQAWLEQRGLAEIELRNISGVEIEADDVEVVCATGGRHAAEMPESENGDFHMLLGNYFRGAGR
jgi:hypothetical protein